MAFRKSSRCDSHQCVEVDLDEVRADFRSAAQCEHLNCVEVADNVPGVVLVRDNKDLDGPVLTFKPGAWRAFVGGLKRG